MPYFKIVIEDSVSRIAQKIFEADSMEDAVEEAAAENWDDESWEEIDSNTSCEIRDELCEEVSAPGDIDAPVPS